MDVTLTPFNSTLYREQQELDSKQLKTKPCSQIQLPRLKALKSEDFTFDRAAYPNIDRWLDAIASQPGWKHPYDLMPRALPGA